MGRRLALLLGVVLALLPVAAAEVWTPQINVAALEGILVEVARWALRISALIVITIAILKIVYGRIQVGAGLPGITMRGYSELWEGLTSVFWFAVSLIVLPFVVWALAVAGLLPGWVAELMSKIIEGLWSWGGG